MANKTLSFFEQIFQTIGGILIAFIRQIAPFAVPAAPAFFLAHAVGSAADSLEPGLGIYVGIVAALGLESAGILGAHYAVSMYTKNDPRYPVAIGATVAYLIIGIATIWLLDTDTNGRIVGTAMFLIAAIVYLLVGMAESDRQTAVAQQSDTDHQHRMDVLDRKLKHEAQLARIQAKTQVQPPQVDKVAAQPASIDTQLDTLTPAQLRVYRAIAAQPDATNTEIAAQLGISRQAVSNHVRNMNGIVQELRG